MKEPITGPKAYSPFGKTSDAIFMQFPFIRCYHQNFPVPPHSFFLLSKGNNAGKPAPTPWVNSFMVTCPNEGYYEFYYWLYYGLWNAAMFKVRLRGSVIPFINIGDARDVLREVAPAIHANWARYKEILTALERLQQYKSTLNEQIAATSNLQQAILQRYLHEYKKEEH